MENASYFSITKFSFVSFHFFHCNVTVKVIIRNHLSIQ